MRITQGTFSFLPDLTDEEIALQLSYAIGNGWAVSIESTGDPRPDGNLWEMWGLPMFGLRDPAGALREVNECRAVFPGRYVKVSAYDARPGRQTTALSFLVQRPPQ
jgi:ribulose-bisphosphate carboxylase small chain